MIITRRTYINVLKLIAFLVIAYLLYFFISVTLSQRMLGVKENKGEFQLSNLLPMQENRIFYESLLTKKEHFIGARGTIDSSYYFSIIKLGKIRQSQKLYKFIIIRSTDIPERTSWFNYDIISPNPLSIMQNFIPYLNVVILPISILNKLEMNVRGRVNSYAMISDTILEYEIDSSNIDFSFNDLNKNDFRYASFYNSKSSIIFIEDKFNNLYIMNLAPIIELKAEGGYNLKAPYKSLQEIL